MRLIKTLISGILIFQIPALPDSVFDVLNDISGYIGTGVSILSAFIGPEALSVLASFLLIIVAVEVGSFAYTAAMWVIHKIPLLGIH